MTILFSSTGAPLSVPKRSFLVSRQYMSGKLIYRQNALRTHTLALELDLNELRLTQELHGLKLKSTVEENKGQTFRCVQSF